MTTQFNLGGGFNAEDQLNEEVTDKKDKITLRYQSRNKTKGFTIIENFAKGLSADNLIKFMKFIKTKLCVTCVAIDSNSKTSIKANKLKGITNYDNIIIQLQGHKIKEIKKFLIKNYNYTNEDIIIRG
jgi:translation initiation factor 1 (eIF-1/SUI1)